MIRGIRIILLLVAASVTRTAAAEEKFAVINLGGLRQVRATVHRGDEHYLIQVRMLPVSCFVAATNARLNRDKAEQYAYQGLARYLSTDKVVRFEISGARVEKTGWDGRFYLMELKVPRAGVVRLDRQSEAASRKTPAEPTVRVAFDAPLFTRKRDHLHTLQRLAEGLAGDLHNAEQAADKSKKQRETFPLAVAELEERGDDNFRKMRQTIADDLLLLKIEKDEIIADLRRRQERWRKDLRDAVHRHEDKTREKP